VTYFCRKLLPGGCGVCLHLLAGNECLIASHLDATTSQGGRNASSIAFQSTPLNEGSGLTSVGEGFYRAAWNADVV